MKKAITLVLVLCLFGFWGYAQEKTISGTITSCEDSFPLPGVSVVIKGTTTGTISDIDGKFSIVVNSDDVILFSFVGYESVEQTVGAQQELQVQLCEDVTGLDEVVIVGYGVKKKSLVTGAISSVNAEEVVSSVQRAEQALQGKAAGVTVLPTSGAPGSGMKVRIRGAGSNGDSEPLYIVDGMKTGDINFLNPSDIASMEVLKDAASAAIYGAEGGNGVVIITTKKGKKGEGTVNYDFQYGIQSPPNTPDLMNAAEYAHFQREIYGTPAVADLDASAALDPTGTNYFDAVLENAPMVQHNLSFSGGAENSSYLFSLGYQSQDGIIGGSKANYERLSARINSVYDVKKWLEVGNNFSYSQIKRSALEEDDGFNGVVNSMIMMDPTTKDRYSYADMPQHMQDIRTAGNTLLRDYDGNYYGISSYIPNGEIYNPLIRIDKTTGVTTDNKFLGSAYLKLKPFKGFEFTSRAGMDLAFQNFHQWTPSFYGNESSLSNSPGYDIDERKWSTWLWENFASYTNSFLDHNFTVLAGMSSQEHQHNWIETSGSEMLKEDPLFAYPDHIDDHTNDLIAGSMYKTSMVSYFGRLSYDYANRYLLEATFRSDGSSLFGPENKFGTFPSFSAGWNISNEAFWNVDQINYLKLRASWGKNGSLSNLGVDQYLSLITSTNIVYPDGTGALIPGSEPDLLANAELRWESSQQTDIGLDMRAFDDRFVFGMDYFNKQTNDLLTLATPALSLGNDAPFANAGDVVNKGWEFMLGYRDQAGDFKYGVNVNLTTIKNEVTYLNENVTRIGGADLPTLGTLTYFEVGQPVWYYRGYQTDGIFVDQAQIDQWMIDNNMDGSYTPQPGDPIVVNNVDDGTINDADMDYIGDPHPDLIYSINIDLAWKGFDFNMFMQGVAGNENYMGFVRADRANTNRLAYFYDNRWNADYPNSTLPRADYNGVHFLKSDLMVSSGSYLKIRQMQLGYTLPTAWTQKVKMSKVRAFVSLNDFFTFSSYKGLDPEVGSNEVNRQGVDFGIYPVSKKVLFGLNVAF